MEKKFGDKVGFYFLCETKNIEEANKLFKMYGFDKIAFVDSSINFYETHNLDPMLGNDAVFLLDSSSTILSIGNPNENLEIDSLFNRIILGHFSQK